MATQTAPILQPLQPDDVQTKFHLELPIELALSLHEWFQRAADVGDLNHFANEVFRIPVIEYRRLNLPLRQSPKAYTRIDGGREGKLSEEQTDELYELYDRAECTVPALAERFGVGQSTVHRALKKRRQSTSGAHPRLAMTQEEK